MEAAQPKGAKRGVTIISARVQSSAKACVSKSRASVRPEARVPTQPSLSQVVFGQGLGGRASVGVGAQPLLGRKRIWPRPITASLPSAARNAAASPRGRDRHVEGRPGHRAEKAERGKRERRRAQNRGPPEHGRKQREAKENNRPGRESGQVDRRSRPASDLRARPT